MPEPPCITTGTPVSSLIFSILSKSSLGSLLYIPCTVPNEAASASIPVSSTKIFASSGSVYAPIILSSAPSAPIAPSSASILAPYSSARAAAYLVFATFSLKGNADPSYIIPVNPRSSAVFISKKLLP